MECFTMSAERIKALEVQQVNDSNKIDRVLLELQDQGRDIEEIKLSLGRQRGYIAGAMSVVVVIWTVVLSAVMVLWDRVVDSVSGMFP
jgi:hypothetical protein